MQHVEVTVSDQLEPLGIAVGQKLLHYFQRHTRMAVGKSIDIHEIYASSLATQNEVTAVELSNQDTLK